MVDRAHGRDRRGCVHRDGIALPDSTIEKWPSIPLETLANDAALRKFLDAMAWFLDEVKRAATEPASPV